MEKDPSDSGLVGAPSRVSRFRAPALNVLPVATRGLKRYVLLPLILVVAFFMLYPLFMVIYGSFRGGPPNTEAPFTLDGYVRAWTAWGTHKALITTFALAIPRLVLGMALGILMTWIVTRTNTPGRLWLERLIWFKIFLPFLPISLAWLFLLSGHAGIINQWLMKAFGLSQPPLDIRSYWGIIALSVLMFGGMAYMFISPAFRNMDASLEESSRVSGASNLTTLRKVTVPLLAPAVLGSASLAFLFIVASFEMELILGTPKGIFVFTTYVWFNLSKVPVDYPAAMALSNVFIPIVLAVIFLQFKVLGKRSFVTITGRGARFRPTDLGQWRWVALSLMLLFFAVTILVPLASLIIGSFQKTWGVATSGWTLRHWRDAFADPSVLRSLKNTLVLALGVATGCTLLYSLLSYASLRTRLAGRQLIEALSWVPRMAPGIVMAVGFAWAFLGGLPLFRPLYGTLALMGLVIVVEAMPVQMRVMNGGMVQVAAELEESARVAGGSWFRTMGKVVFPLLAPTLLSAWLLAFLGATRTMVLVLFIYIGSSKVLALDIYERWLSTDWEQASVLGVMLTAITMGVAVIAQVVAYRQRRALGEAT